MFCDGASRAFRFSRCTPLTSAQPGRSVGSWLRSSRPTSGYAARGNEHQALLYRSRCRYSNRCLTAVGSVCITSGCVPYDPAGLKLLERANGTWLLERSDGAQFRAFANKSDADAGLASAMMECASSRAPASIEVCKLEQSLMSGPATVPFDSVTRRLQSWDSKTENGLQLAFVKPIATTP